MEKILSIAVHHNLFSVVKDTRSSVDLKRVAVVELGWVKDIGGRLLGLVR